MPNLSRCGFLRTIRKNRMLFYPVAVAAAVRVIGAFWLYHLLSEGGAFHTDWMDTNPRLIPGWSSGPNLSVSSNWLWLFNAWDSPQFQLIAQLGYVHPDYVYLPGYPILIRIVGTLIGNYWLAAFLLTQGFALASLVVFQMLARLYMKPKEALCATLLMAIFPEIIVFTTLGYSEALFLFSTISAWYLYKTQRTIPSLLLAGLASVTRIYGIAIIIPMFLDIVKTKHYRRLLQLVIPASFLASWFLFCYLSTGDPLASWNDEKWFTSNISSKFSLAQTIINQLLRGIVGAVPVPFYIDPPILIALSLFVYLIARTWQVDRPLSAYAVAIFGALMFTATNQLALLRFLTFIFPIWLTIRVRSLFLVAVCITFLAPVALLLWLYAITVTFVG